MSISFLTIEDEDKDFEKGVKSANKIWTKVFSNEYEEGQCPGNFLTIGSIDNEPVCAVIIKISDSKKALISSMGAYPQKCGYGSSLMQNIIKFIKNLGVTEICLKIDKDDKAERLDKFYSNYGFTKVEEDEEYEEDAFFYYDSNFEYIMSCKLDLDLDLDLTNLKIN